MYVCAWKEREREGGGGGGCHEYAHLIFVWILKYSEKTKKIQNDMVYKCFNLFLAGLYFIKVVL